MTDQIEVQFWGMTGAFPAPGGNHLKYGGHTSCVTLKFPNQRLFIMDAGSGIIPLGHQLLSSQKEIEATLFITHEHWDHIHGLLFFKPLYHPGNQFTIYGPAQGNESVHQLLSTQMNGVYFPVKFNQLPANISVHDITHNTHLEIDDIHVTTIQLQHPCVTLGYRIQYHHKVICYLLDNEIYYQNDKAFNADFVRRLINFSKDADLVVIDCGFTDEEYQVRIGWGHSCPSQVIPFAHQANIKTLALHHHDQSETDDVVDDKLVTAKKMLKDLDSKTECIAPFPGQIIAI